MKKVLRKTGLAAVLLSAAVFATGIPAIARENDPPLDFGATEYRYPDGRVIKVPEYDWRTVEPAPDLAENLDNSNEGGNDSYISSSAGEVHGGENS